MTRNRRNIKSIRFKVDQAKIQWNDAQADKERLKAIIKKKEEEMAPTNYEINAMLTEIRREARFNIVSKNMQELKNREENNKKKFVSRYKQTLPDFFSDIRGRISIYNDERRERRERIMA